MHHRNPWAPSLSGGGRKVRASSARVGRDRARREGQTRCARRYSGSAALQNRNPGRTVDRDRFARRFKTTRVPCLACNVAPPAPSIDLPILEGSSLALIDTMWPAAVVVCPLSISVNACSTANASKPRHEIDVVFAVRERQRLAKVASTKEIRIVDLSRQRHRLASHAAIEQRQFRIDARQRAVDACCAGDSYGHALRQHQIQNAVLQSGSANSGGDRRLDQRRVDAAVDRFIRRHPDAQHVLGRQRARARIVLADALRVRAVVVDDDGNVFSGLGVTRRCKPEAYRYDGANDTAPARR